MAAATPRWKRLLALSWRVPAAVVGSLTLAVLIAMLGLGVTGSTRDMLTDTTATRGLALALVPTLALALATLTGLITGTTVVASLVRDTLAGQSARYAAGWGRAWRTLPRVAALGALSVPALALSFFFWPLISVAVLGRAAWRMRKAESRSDATKSPRTGLWLAIPFAGTLAVLAAVPTTWSSLVAGSSLRESVLASAYATLRARGLSLIGLLALGAASWGLGVACLSFTAKPGASMSEFATGTAALGVSTALLIAFAGTLLGLLTHTLSEPPAPVPGRSRLSRSVAFSRFWRPTRLTGVASMVVTAMLLPTGISALGAAASAFGEEDTDIVVNTLADSAVVPANQCVAGAQCGIRAALAKAAAASALGQPARVRFDVEGTVSLAATLKVGTGVTVDGNYNHVVLDARRQFGALETFQAATGEGGGRVVLLGLTVVGGRSAVGGAGLYSSGFKVEMADMTFTDNISDAGSTSVPVASRNGGAVLVLDSNLRVENSTFNDNFARSGVGGAIAATNLILTNATLADNNGISGRLEGGAVHATTGELLHVTAIGGGGVSGTTTSDITVRNSAISTAGGALPCARIVDPSTGFGSVGNVDPAGTCLGKTADLDPIGPLADNGGLTKTVALLPGSPARGAADLEFCQPADQRHSGRGNTSCDSGAFQASVDVIPDVDVNLEVTPNPVSTTDQVRLQATMTSEAQIPTGTVRFLDGTDVLADNVGIDGNQRFVATVGPLAQGPHQVTAEFVPTFGGSTQTSPATKLQVQAPVTMALTGSGPTRIHAPATITATITADDDAAGTPAPAGEVTFTNGSTEEKVDVVDGTATWHTNSLQRASVSAVSSGDDYHSVAVAGRNLTTENVPTTSTVTAPDLVEYNDRVSITADVSDEVGPVFGWAKLEVDGVAHGTGYLRDGKASFTI
ncbi:MAG: hypothetical protein JWR90_3299 [Marmoricola sp.]|nr:hypothetical protein [Marmoricola sp.]